jgi:hypothetical protein
VARGEVATSREGMARLRTEHALPPGTAVALETGTVSFFAARELSRVGLRPVVVDAHEVRLKAHRPRQESDRRDALELCEGIRRGIYRTIVHVPPLEVSRLRETLSRRRHFVRLQTSEVNAANNGACDRRGSGIGPRQAGRNWITRSRGRTKLCRCMSGSIGWYGDWQASRSRLWSKRSRSSRYPLPSSSSDYRAYRAWDRSWPPRPSRSFPTSVVSRRRSKRPVMPVWSHRLTNRGITTRTDGSPRRDRGSFEPCCAKQLIKRRAPIIRSIPTSENCVRSTGKKWPW